MTGRGGAAGRTRTTGFFPGAATVVVFGGAGSTGAGGVACTSTVETGLLWAGLLGVAAANTIVMLWVVSGGDAAGVAAAAAAGCDAGADGIDEAGGCGGLVSSGDGLAVGVTGAAVPAVLESLELVVELVPEPQPVGAAEASVVPGSVAPAESVAGAESVEAAQGSLAPPVADPASAVAVSAVVPEPASAVVPVSVLPVAPPLSVVPAGSPEPEPVAVPLVGSAVAVPPVESAGAVPVEVPVAGSLVVESCVEVEVEGDDAVVDPVSAAAAGRANAPAAAKATAKKTAICTAQPRSNRLPPSLAVTSPPLPKPSRLVSYQPRRRSTSLSLVDTPQNGAYSVRDRDESGGKPSLSSSGKGGTMGRMWPRCPGGSVEAWEPTWGR